MFGLESLIVNRAREALTGLSPAWQVYGFSVSTGERASFPQASVMFAEATVSDTKTGAVNVMPGFRVTLAVRKGLTAPARLDEAVAAVIASLHNWAPGASGDRNWNRLALMTMAPPQYADDGVVGIELTFSTHARYDGQN